MGNSNGHFGKFWEVFKRFPRMQGGFIWDWVDQGILTKSPDGESFFGYGGDFGEKSIVRSSPDGGGVLGYFCLNGVIFPDRTPKPALEEVKKVHQWVEFRDLNLDDRIVILTNNYNFLDLNQFVLHWELSEDGFVIQQGESEVSGIQPGESREISIQPDIPASPKPGAEYRILIRLSLREDNLWAAAGHVVAWEQFDLDFRAPEKPILEVSGALDLVRDSKNQIYRIKGNGFEFTVDANSGDIRTIMKNGLEIGSASAILSLWRAPVDNDWGMRGRDSAPMAMGGIGIGEGIAWDWKSLGLDQLTVRIDEVSVEQVSETIVETSVNGELIGKDIAFDFETNFRFFGTGDVAVEQNLSVPYRFGWIQCTAIVIFGIWIFSIRTGKKRGWLRRWLVRIPFFLSSIVVILFFGFAAYAFFQVTPLPRVGSHFMLPHDFEKVRWYGRGPHENYSDRNQGSPFGVYEGSVSDQFVPYIHPQENGNKTDVRWVSLGNKSGMGILVSGDNLSVSAHHYTLESLSKADHVPDLKRGDLLTLNIDFAQSGVGTDFMGTPPLEEYLLDDRSYRLRYRFRTFDLSMDDPGTISRNQLPNPK